MRNMLLLLLFTLFVTTLHAAQCTISAQDWAEKKECTLTVSSTQKIAPNRIEIVYSPNSKIEQVQVLPFAPSQQVIPHRPGIVKIMVKDDDGAVLCSTKLSVRFHGIPWSGVIIFLLAGTTLFTGTFISLRRALKG